MDRDSLSNIQFYYTPPELIQKSSLIISGDEVQHISRVMRHQIGDALYVTDGIGYSYVCRIERIDKKVIHCSFNERSQFTNPLANLTICVPRLKTSDRFEMSLEKCVELGITNFIVFETERTLSKGDKSERWQKILLSAMKQCQRTFLPTVRFVKSVSKLNEIECHKIVFEQVADTNLEELISSKKLNKNENLLLVFGPEGGLSEKELSSLENKTLVNMNQHRLRSETAIIAAVSIITFRLS